MSQSFPNNTALVFPDGQAITFDPVAFDRAIQSQGVQMIHFRAMRCPVGMIDKDDMRRPHDDHSGCSNGFIYTKAGTLTTLFTSNSKRDKQQDVGIVDGSTVEVTSRRFYDDQPEKEIRVVPYDRFYMAEENLTVDHWQLVESHITGRDKLRFPAVEIFDVMDSNGKRYSSSDYAIENGQLVWTNGGPGINPTINKGLVYSVRFAYAPFFYVQRVNHQVRVAQVQTQLERRVERMPQSFVLMREAVFEKADNDELGQNDPADPHSALRQVKGPGLGLLGPR